MADDFEVALLLKAFHCFTTQAAVREGEGVETRTEEGTPCVCWDNVPKIQKRQKKKS